MSFEGVDISFDVSVCEVLLWVSPKSVKIFMRPSIITVPLYPRAGLERLLLCGLPVVSAPFRKLPELQNAPNAPILHIGVPAPT